jgi:hypothetical protein
VQCWKRGSWYFNRNSVVRREIFSVVARYDQKLEVGTSNFPWNKESLTGGRVRGECILNYQRLQAGYAINFPWQQTYCEHKNQMDACRLQLKCDGTRWHTREGKWRGNWRMEWVAGTLYTTSEHGASSITTADAHTSASGRRLNWRPRLFKWARPFRRKTKYGFCACAITFQLASTTACLAKRL